MPDQTDVGVLVIDDHAVFRAAAREIIEATPGFAPVGEASSCQEGLALADRVHPDFVLVDLRMPKVDGIETARRIRAKHSHAVVVLVSLVEPTDVPLDRSGEGAVAMVRKQDLRPAMLDRLWSEHGVSPGAWPGPG